MTLDLDALKSYLGNQVGQFSDAQIQAALQAETVAQKRACTLPADYYPDDLAEALCRRVARNLAMRNVPLGIQVSGDLTSIRLGSTDPEVRRLEGPYRRRTVG